MNAMDYHQFEKMVRAEGFSIRPTTKHHAVYTPDGKKLTSFAVSHGGGRKRMVLAVYVRRVMADIRRYQEDQRDE